MGEFLFKNDIIPKFFKKYPDLKSNKFKTITIKINISETIEINKNNFWKFSTLPLKNHFLEYFESLKEYYKENYKTFNSSNYYGEF